MTHYDVLEISATATDDEIKKAYRRQALKHHPDLHQDDRQEHKKKFLAIKKAYEVLIHHPSRALYDLQLIRERKVPGGYTKEAESQFHHHFYNTRKSETYTKAHAEAWEADKKAAKFNRMRAERKHHRTTQARQMRRAQQLRRFWQTHGGVTWQDVLMMLGCLGFSCGLWLVTQNHSKLNLKAKDP